MFLAAFAGETPWLHLDIAGNAWSGNNINHFTGLLLSDGIGNGICQDQASLGIGAAALVGKGVTFDSGGYSLKTGGSMRGMKGDMAGGAAGCGALFDIPAAMAPHPSLEELNRSATGESMSCLYSG